AWEYNAYDFWVSQVGTPAERAKEDLENPRAMLRKYSKYLDDVQGKRIANICGSCGKKAVPLAIMGASVTVFDISKENMRYACETAEAAGTKMEYIVGDVMDIELSVYGNYFDIVFMEGGILHYFHDINQFMEVMNKLLKKDGIMICSDFHPIHKIIDANGLGNPKVDYFSSMILEGEMAHAKFYDEEKRKNFPKVSIRLYTLSEIINSVINNGFHLISFDEHPSWTDKNLPGEFTILASKTVIST
ncbi:MAG: SAM-dependent methyltransferase, partial [Lachnospiraceae bacterium]|nr:SAM-dependent methyltransferase [Lachnospiraceae bacterium]